MENIFKGKKIIVTGGAGSIGSHIVKSLLKHEPKQIRVFDNRESELFFLQQELADHKNVTFLVGDVRDKERLDRAMHNIDIVFHAAALKHVPSCEYNSFEAIKTNVLGTQNVIEVAMDNDIDRVMNISTDKAVNPLNTMGTTKLLAEKLIVAAHFFKGIKRTIFSSVRFGNVLGSNGSIVDLLKKQLAAGKDLTITDPDMTRFVMSIEEAVGLILESAEIMTGGEVFILKMPSLKLQDLVDVVAAENGNKGKIKIRNIGIRPGEKMNEALITDEEAKIALETDKMYIIPPPKEIYFKFNKEKFGETKKVSDKKYCSEENDLLKKEDIKQILKHTGVV